LNLLDATNPLRTTLFKFSRFVVRMMPRRCIKSFGTSNLQISSIVVVNLDRQPSRWRRVQHELNGFASSDGVPLKNIATRMSAIDARDGRETAATADVDPLYTMGDQLFVEPDPRLEECFGHDEPIRMTRQEIAVARSHIETWKLIANGNDAYVLVLEDDVWFARDAAKLIDNGWSAAHSQDSIDGAAAPQLLYFSYKDAGGKAKRINTCDALFQPVRGLWYLSGYVLSREGASELLKAMPVVGPVDLWINHQFAKMNVMALSKSAILQREDGGSDNSYSILPYLARAGIVNSEAVPTPPSTSSSGLLFAWTPMEETNSFAMALSMLGRRVRSFYSEDELLLDPQVLTSVDEPFDAYVNPPADSKFLTDLVAHPSCRFVLAAGLENAEFEVLPSSRTLTLCEGPTVGDPWHALSDFLKVKPPDAYYPRDVPSDWRMFIDARSAGAVNGTVQRPSNYLSMDESPWVLPADAGWMPREITTPSYVAENGTSVQAALNSPSPSVTTLVETFPGNLASFDQRGLLYTKNGTELVLRASSDDVRPYRSGAFASTRIFNHGRFEVEIRAASGSGLVTGFFLHRDLPRQEIDVEIMGSDPCSMLVNVYFNPGDDGAAFGYGYRGSPFKVNLGFDATLEFHTYSIDWSPDRICWSVDGKLVHVRKSWDPTPIPHLPMRLHANLWAPGSVELAGHLDETTLPAIARFRNLTMPVS